MKRIAALVPNILDVAPGQRVRIELWAKYLEAYGWTVDFYPFEDDALNEIFYKPGKAFLKAARIVSCYRKQLKLVLDKPQCDVLFIYREAALIGPAWIERLGKRLNVPIVYDLDDPIFLTYRSPASGWSSLLKFPLKTHSLFKMSDRIIAINDIIGDYAKKFNPSVSVVPNIIDPDKFCPAPITRDDVIRIGWSGSYSTMHQLKAVAAPLRRLQAKYKVSIRVVGSGKLEIDGVDLDVRQWTPQTEVSDLQDCDIGIVPLVESPFNKWKFFLKVGQYLAIGLPVVAQKAGSNSDVIKNGINGFVVETEDEWYDRLSLLIENADLRRQMSKAARQTVLDNYTPQVQMPHVAQIFEDVLAQSKSKNGNIFKQGSNGS